MNEEDTMSLNLLYILNHDLPTNSEEVFLREFSKRTNGNFDLYDYDKFSKKPEKGKWHLGYHSNDDSFESFFPNSVQGLNLFFNDDDVDLRVDFGKRVASISGIKSNLDKEINCYCWDGINDIFINHVEFAKKWGRGLLHQINEFLVPLFHSTSLMLLKDTFSDLHQTLYEKYLNEEGQTIEQALKSAEAFAKKTGRSFVVLRNDEVFGHDQDLEEPVFLFDV